MNTQHELKTTEKELRNRLSDQLLTDYKKSEEIL